jgi:hypothetical protein
MPGVSFQVRFQRDQSTVIRLLVGEAFDASAVNRVDEPEDVLRFVMVVAGLNLRDGAVAFV